jgi:uncharacterized protein
MERFQWLAAIIAAHPDHRVYGRTRLQKTVKILQRLGAPLDYEYMIHFYGPYSEGLQSEIGLLEKMGLVKEYMQRKGDGSPYYVLEATSQAIPLSEDIDLQGYKDAIKEMNNTEGTVLELAATYDAFRELGSDPEEAKSKLIAKKGSKCDEGRAENAIDLLVRLGLN